MAAATASFVAMSLGTSAALQPASAQKLSVARFNGLKACPMLRQRAAVCRPAAIRSLTIRAAAKPETLSQVQEIIAGQLACGVEKVIPEAKFADLGADSLDTVEIIMALEETFKISLDEEGAQKISTVQEAADMIQISIES
jgi:acyl carrier protein